jgi:trimeric autotransporter adhesin
LYNILLRESSFNPRAQNPTSTAFGLFQFLNSTWATVNCTKTSDAYRQSVCGLRYIKRRYGTPEAAWRFWQQNHWY